MSEKDKNLTVYQKLYQMFSGGDALRSSPVVNPKYKLDSQDLIVTNSREDFEREKLQLQQQRYMKDQWERVDNEMYQKAVYYETSRIASYMDYEAMEFSIAGDTKIATPDGFITIKELADKGRDHEFITYAYDHNLKQVVPAKARNAHYTRDEMTYKITFDDDSYIIATHGHRFLKRNGEFEVVENLKEGDSMMPFYRKSFFNNNNYNWVYTCNPSLGSGKNGWVPEHDLIAEWFYRPKQENEEVHHLDFNGKNNNPENLLIMDKSEHRSYHATHNNKKLWANPEYREKMLEVSKRTDNKHRWDGVRSGKNNPAYINLPFNDIIKVAKEHRTLIKTAKILKVSIKKIQNELKFNGFKNWFDFLEVYDIPKYVPQSEDRDSINFNLIPWDLIIETAKTHKTIHSTCNELGITTGKMRSTLRQGGYNKWSTFMSAYGLDYGKSGRKKVITDKIIINHKIKSVEPYKIIPVYDLTVPGYKNFATDTIFSHNTPEISVTLDIMSEESCTLNEQGQMLSIYSDSTRIKKVLEDLFFNVLDIHSNLPMWTRNTCKYGDNFLYLKLDYKKGIIGSSQLTNIEITREEANIFPYKGMDNKDEKDSKGKQVSFTWKDKNMDFNAWEIAHFRLLGDDRKLPYGTSVLEKIRRIWKQLLLAEDAMLVYRVTRAPERRVFKIYVGNIDDADIESYVQKVANKFKRTQTADKQTGQTDIRYNTLAVDQDFFVPVRDPNASMPIETLPGASNLDQIADIQFIQRKLVTALRVPKPILGFDEAVGDGKNLALLDIRFARTINRIQQAMIQELNKIAIIHLYILGFHDELGNFKISLNNPSTQGEMLKVEQWKEKVLLYKDLVSAIDGGMAPTSHTWAKKNIFNWSEDEITLDLEQQRLERAASKELEMTSEIIKKTGFFDKIDKLYGEIPTKQGSEEDETDGGEDAGGFGGGEETGGFGGFGGGEEAGGFGGGEEAAGGEETGGFGEGFRGDEGVIDKLLLEGNKKNEDILSMTNGINELLKDFEEKK
jgi:hypothetical protein